MSGSLLPQGRAQFFDQYGAPLVGGTVTSYVPGTTTPKTTYQDPALSIPNANPITLDSAGTCLLWGSGAYRIIVHDASGNTISDSTVYAPATQNADGTLSGNPATNSGEFVTLGQAQTNFAALSGLGTQTFEAANATPGTQEVMPISQADGRYAALAGLASQIFSAANGTTGNEVVNWSQVTNTTPIFAGGAVAGTSVSTTTSTLSAPSTGIAVVISVGVGSVDLNGISLSASLAGLVTTTASGFQGSYALGYLPMKAGQTSTFTGSVTASTTGNLGLALYVFFLPLG